MAALIRMFRSLRTTTAWVLVMCVFVGPVGLGASSALAAPTKSCGTSCPCDEAEAEEHDKGEHDGEHGGHVEAEPCDDENADPCDEECPDGCPTCACCLGIAVALPGPPAAPGAVAYTSTRILEPVQAAPSGTRTGVFRPPRSLT